MNRELIAFRTNHNFNPFKKQIDSKKVRTEGSLPKFEKQVVNRQSKVRSFWISRKIKRQRPHSIEEQVETMAQQPKHQKLSFLEYEQIKQMKLIKPSHFQDLALKNDIKENKSILSSFQILSTPQTQTKYSAIRKQISCQKSKANEEQSLTIISNEIGSISSQRQRATIEQKWKQNQQFKFQSVENDSSDDQKQAVTVRKVKRQRRDTNIRCKDGEINQSFHHLIKRINSGKQIQIMSQPEDRLLIFKDLYKPKKIPMIHKLNWKF